MFLFPAEQILTDLVLFFESIGSLLVSNRTKLISKECVRSYRSFREICIWEEENQLDATQGFIELLICSTCFGHVYAHHQELATILLVWHVACNSCLLVVGRSGAGSRLCVRVEGCCQHPSSRTHSLLSAPSLPTTSNQELHATCHTSSIVASS